MKKGLDFRIQKRKKAWKTESEEGKTREKVQRSLGFLVFHFLPKGNRERTL